MEEFKSYNKDQCVYRNKKMPCFLCSAMCKERYEDFKNRGIKVEFIKIDKNEKIFVLNIADRPLYSNFFCTKQTWICSRYCGG